jgi:hypothetical protein
MRIPGNSENLSRIMRGVQERIRRIQCDRTVYLHGVTSQKVALFGFALDAACGLGRPEHRPLPSELLL